MREFLAIEPATGDLTIGQDLMNLADQFVKHNQFNFIVHGNRQRSKALLRQLAKFVLAQ